MLNIRENFICELGVLAVLSRVGQHPQKFPAIRYFLAAEQEFLHGLSYMHAVLVVKVHSPNNVCCRSRSRDIQLVSNTKGEFYFKDLSLVVVIIKEVKF